MRPTITATIITQDEEANLEGCLAALDWVDELVVVDGGSRDRTVAIARARGARVVLQPFTDYADQRNLALDHATGGWVLSVDADERVTPGLRDEIRRRLSDPAGGSAGYRVPIRSSILGRPFRHSGTQNDRPIRLFRRTRGRWTGAIHEVVKLGGPVGQLRHYLAHTTLPTIPAFLAKIDRYTTLGAAQMLRQGRSSSWWRMVLDPPLVFARLYLAKGGVLDGPEGLAFCALSAVSSWIQHAKHRALVRYLAEGAGDDQRSESVFQGPHRRPGDLLPRWGCQMVADRWTARPARPGHAETAARTGP